ncbi:MAG: hypothetical protein LC104_10520 [Bacteroidales bacterium]|nr:hypothetical protein [Bacteroidales bacterium]
MLVCPPSEQKIIYRALHHQLSRLPELMDTQFLYELQSTLQKQAQAEGVDVSDHGAWDAWLGNDVAACSVRNAKRAVIKPR